MTQEFDYVIIGAGSAGCVLALRLAEAGNTVCILEAGPGDKNPFIRIPAGFIKAVSSPRLTWGFVSAPVPGAKGRSMPLVQAKLLGGGSSINGMIYNRCQPADYDTWAQMGNRGWSYDEVLPYFRKSERRIGAGDEKFHGRSGPMPVSDLNYPHTLCDLFVAAAKAQGISTIADYNGAAQEGVGPFQFTIDRSSGRELRVSTASAFLKPAKRTRRVSVRTNCLVEKIAFEGRRAVGARYIRNGGRGPTETVQARREVIVSAGAINTPRILQVSGIGNGEQLRSIGQEVLVDSPGVGANLSDHYQIRLAARLQNVRTFNERSSGLPLLLEIAKWILGRPSILGVGPVPVHLFHRTDRSLESPDLQMSFTPASFKAGEAGRLDNYPGMTIGGYQQRPESRGYVRAKSIDVSIPPEIQPNYLNSPHDCQAVIEIVKMARRFIRSPYFAPYVVEESFPGNDVGDTDADILEFVRQFGGTAFHHTGTARMGPDGDPMAVVDRRLRVRGADSLRVIDASVIPVPVSGNTNAPTIMVAEKAADMVIADAVAR